MCKSDNETSDQKDIMNIERAFKDRESDKFYKYYYHNEETKEVISTWDQLREFYYRTFPKHEASKWLFRGDVFAYKDEDDSERKMGEAFKTSLDKAFEEFSPVKPQDRNRIEKAIIREFRRRAHLLSVDKSNTQNQLEALTLLRHHGGPARILDWMYSFFPAVYLAMNREYNKKDECTTYTIWALNRKWLNREDVLFENETFLKDNTYFKEHSLKREDIEYSQKYDNNNFQKFVVTYIINRNSKSLIYAASPYRLNERLVSQRGTLLFSGTLDQTWGENLRNMITESLKNRRRTEEEGPVLCEIPFRLTKEDRKNFLMGLDEMNINQATLFPDLGGFAESLRTRIAHPESLAIDV